LGSVSWALPLPQMVPNLSDDVDLTGAAEDMVADTSNFQSWNPAVLPADDMDLYFTWQDPSHHVVDELIFHEERDLCKGSDRESSLYSAALENVVSVSAT